MSNGRLMLSPKADGSGLSIRPFGTKTDGGLANAKGSLKGVADVMLRVCSALEQLLAPGIEANSADDLISYVYFDAWELGGLQPTYDAAGHIVGRSMPRVR